MPRATSHIQANSLPPECHVTNSPAEIRPRDVHENGANQCRNRSADLHRKFPRTRLAKGNNEARNHVTRSQRLIGWDGP